MTIARYLCLVVPLALTLAGCRFERGRDARAAALLGFIAAAIGLAGLLELARVANWYAFAQVDSSWRGTPVDLWLGWAALWAAVPVLFRRVLPVPIALGSLLWLDAVTMPALHPLVLLGPDWLVGECVGLLAVALPAQLLGRWTADRTHLGGRVALQVVVFTAGLLWLLPTAAFEVGDGSWAELTRLPLPHLFVLGQLAALLAVPALLAVREFARAGGTPYPWDPPGRLVHTGPYAYLANPMQVSSVTLVALMAAAGHSTALAAAAGASVAFSIGVARPHEQHAMATRYGAAWHRYRASVREWWPRWRPYQHGPPAVLWLDQHCDACQATHDFLRDRDPWQLTLESAGEHPSPLWRARYRGGDGHDEGGVAAVAHALEHVNLVWAYLGWLLRLPGIRWLAQLVTDAMIASPHPTNRPAATSEPAATSRPAATSEGGMCPPTPSSDSSTARCGPSTPTASRACPPAPSPQLPG